VGCTLQPWKTRLLTPPRPSRPSRPRLAPPCTAAPCARSATGRPSTTCWTTA
jgi:hypothetical protein